MGSALNSQVVFGAGFPLATQAKRAEEPAATTWSFGTSTTETGSVEERQKDELAVLFGPQRRHSALVLTENVDSIAGADDGPLCRLHRTAVGPCITRRHGNKGQVGMLLMVKWSQCDLFIVF